MRKHGTVRMGLLPKETAAVFLLGSMFLAGGVVGCMLAGRIQGDSGIALQDYLKAYFALAEGAGVNAGFLDVMWEQFCFPLLVFVLGFTAVGVVGVPVAFSIKGFMLSYSVACFCRMFGFTGLLPALFLFGFPALLWAPALFILGIQAVDTSYAMLCCCLGTGVRPAFCEGSFWWRCILCMGLLVLCVALEYWILPAFMQSVAGFML